MSKKLKPLGLALLTVLGGVAQSVPAEAQSTKQYVASNSDARKGSAAIDTTAVTKGPGGYRVGVDDELRISIWHEPELSQGVVVRPDGMITLPLLNDIKVAGLTTEEMQALLTERLKSIVNEPQVTIIVKASKSRKVYLVGSVGKPGPYPLTDQLTALQLIASAGGLGLFAKTGSMYVLRTVNGKPLRLAVNYKKALAGKGGDLVLEPGDMLVVP